MSLKYELRGTAEVRPPEAGLQAVALDEGGERRAWFGLRVQGLGFRV